MKKLKTFFYVFKNSISSPKYYRDILKTDLWFSVKYFLFLSFLASLLFSISLSIKAIPEVVSGIKSFSENVRGVFPDDLVINFKEGKWEANKEEPIVIPMPSFTQDSDKYIPSNIAVFDKAGTIDKLKELNTVVLINNENLIYMGEGDSITAQPINTIPDFTLDKVSVNTRIDTLNTYAKAIPFLLPVIFLISSFVFNYFSVGVFNTLIIGFVVYLVSIIKKNKIDFRSACKIGIHGMTLPIIIQLILITFTDLNMAVPGWFLILSIMISIFFMMKMNGNEDVKKIDIEN